MNLNKVKSHAMAMSLNRYESDLSNELLQVLVGQEVAKISEVKVGD